MLNYIKSYIAIHDFRRLVGYVPSLRSKFEKKIGSGGAMSVFDLMDSYCYFQEKLSVLYIHSSHTDLLLI